MTIQPYGDNFIPIIPVDQVIHTPENPFCGDPTCPCKENNAAIGEVDQAYQDGLITAEHATDIVMGRRPW